MCVLEDVTSLLHPSMLKSYFLPPSGSSAAKSYLPNHRPTSRTPTETTRSDKNMLSQGNTPPDPHHTPTTGTRHEQ